MIIYTDGATSGNGKENAAGGWAWVCPDTDDKDWGSIIIGATNQVCELTAALEACKWAWSAISDNKKKFPPESVEIHSDSAYIVNCYKDQWWKTWERNGWKNSKKEPVANRELWEELIKFFEDPRFTFVKVKGHYGIEGNEMADKLACNGRDLAKERLRNKNGKKSL